jgi:hypothetical protein
VHLEASTGMADGEGLVDLRQRALGEADHRHGPILKAGARQACTLLQGHDLDRLVVEDEAERVGVVNRDVEHHPAAGLGPFDPPALQMRREMDGVEDAGGERATDPPLSHGRPHGTVGRGVAEMVIRAHDHAGLTGCGHHALGVRHAERQRLLAQDVLAGGGRGQRLGPVQLVRGADIDCLYAGHGQQLVEAGAAPCNAVLGGEAAPSFRTRAHHRQHLAVGGPDGAQHVLAGDGAGADQASANWFRHAFRP